MVHLCYAKLAIVPKMVPLEMIFYQLYHMRVV
jgi:hypothetical protein